MNLTDLNIPLICWVSFILLIWFESDIVSTIGSITKTQKLLKLDKYLVYRLNVDLSSNYPNFLYGTHQNLLTKLLSCPICLCFWLTGLSITLIFCIFNVSITLLALIFPMNYLSSLLLYLGVRKLL